MPEKRDIQAVLDRTESYLTGTLLPFWLERSVDEQRGGFLTYFDRDGRPTGETDKTFLMQIRMLFTMASAHRAGYGGGRCAELARHGADFILEHYWDDENEGWIWIADAEGHPTFTGKIGYGQCFGIYAFSEYFLATGDPRGREAALRTLDAVNRRMVDESRGGYFEIMKPDWSSEAPGRRGGDRKSFDVHMHMMEALTALYEMTGDPAHRQRLEDVIELILTRMLHPAFGTGFEQFSLDFEPLPAILFDVEWGSDEAPEGGAAPLARTSYGHNVEFAWLLLHAADVLKRPRDDFAAVVKKPIDHCIDSGLDTEFGGVYVDGLCDGGPLNTRKQFWQQAEVMVGLLDAVALYPAQADRYWDAFANVHRFVFEKFANLQAGGEWRALLERDGTPVWDYLGHAWKISYHTARSTIQCVRRLRRLTDAI